MLNGGQFVEALRRLGYPDSSSLKPSEFDWLFDCAPENLHFLRFVCRTLNSSNILSLEEAIAFQELQSSGKPILDEAALEEVLRTIVPSDTCAVSAASSSVFAINGEVTAEDLEVELKALRKEKELKQKRYNRLQLITASRADADLRLTANMEKTGNKLKEANALVGAENAHTNTVLQNLTDEMNNIASYLDVAHKIGQTDPVATRLSQPPTVLLFQLSLETYLQQEELNTKTLAAFTQKHFFKGISDIVESSCSGRLQLLDLSCCEDEEESASSVGKEGEEQVVDRRRTEMARLQWAHVVAQYQLMQALSEEKSIKTALDWLSEKSSHVKSLSMTSTLHAHDFMLRKELQTMETELEALVHGPVSESLRESARQVNVFVVRGDLALQLARQDYYTQRQNQVRDYLLRQRASFDLLHLAQEFELRRWRTFLAQLKQVSGKLVKDFKAASLRINLLSHLDLGANPQPNLIINSKDVAFSSSNSGLSEPFRTYKALNQAACDLAGELKTTRDALAGGSQEQYYTAARLHSDCEALHGAMYSELQQLVFGPQELSTKLLEAETQLQILQQVMQEILTEVKSKRHQLDRNRLLRHERELYIYFHLDPRLLQKVVEDLETKMSSRGQQ